MSRTADEILEAGIRELNSHGYSGKERHAGEGSKDARIRRATGGRVERSWGGDMLQKARQYAQKTAGNLMGAAKSAAPGMIDKGATMAKRVGADLIGRGEKALNSAGLPGKKMGAAARDMGERAIDAAAGAARGAFAKGGKMKKIDDVSHCVKKAKGGAAKARKGYDM